ncbi:MAG: hypothetical protein WKG07_06895 [Hymenobacter sp.]
MLAATGQTTEQAGTRPARVKAAVARDLGQLLALVDNELLPLTRRPPTRPLPRIRCAEHSGAAGWPTSG